MAQKAQGTGQGRNMNSGDMNLGEQVGGGSGQAEQPRQPAQDRSREQQGDSLQSPDGSDHHDLTPREKEMLDIDRDGSEPAG